MSFAIKERVLAGVGLAGLTFLGTFLDTGCVGVSVIQTPGPKPEAVGRGPAPQEQLLVPDLGLRIDEAGFLNIAQQGPRWGLLPEVVNMDKSGCPKWSPGICVAQYSANFTVAINGPMAEFMYKQSQLTSPIRPVKIIFEEIWQEINKKEHVSGSTNITVDEKEIHILMSLKASAWEVFKELERRNLPLDYFEGALSYKLSRYFVHEAGHAGAEVKKLAKPGRLIPDTDVAESTHPQVYAFDARYDQLYRQAEAKKIAEGALIFGAQPKGAINLLALRNQLYQEARAKGME
ncbi:MAG: hypothetical protein ACD_38C00031G0002 [uncultured bacterium]|uniref:Uncharacterized protein n=1 Tax=Candidatus Daviesbacteria bacterium GW2011_GWC2_40_12 TaxID=1618431 RepID=A0A0G0QMC3_9BACT|nr:MAG: hypothetical protein ACD_38C00031G0002 [uncultured bacterium]KKR41278.1 MAG: hypothetical protein UT77_C0015G0022 [Candidatus Daviesbacteria bacterium GW2011_GWC2_40_12]OGE21500.1 MAG: hypothetical protein A2778_01345 [Candidatus Daviesbacteria bacterium RIFCSPHIGHO2_01_FULL_40_24]OGE42793.1 MAG: hypothetical protein A3A53_05780 [Candidatus Daviesbacteria bacterium RIFCSPLOWO2_01_FULL_39_23]OGE66050.1 MAG: hypothetical protein A3J16_03435 [Candidatus Daviesbacteria bacterium RIFCSPLOWO2